MFRNFFIFHHYQVQKVTLLFWEPEQGWKETEEKCCEWSSWEGKLIENMKTKMEFPLVFYLNIFYFSHLTLSLFLLYPDFSLAVGSRLSLSSRFNFIPPPPPSCSYSKNYIRLFCARWWKFLSKCIVRFLFLKEVISFMLSFMPVHIVCLWVNVSVVEKKVVVEKKM